MICKQDLITNSVNAHIRKELHLTVIDDHILHNPHLFFYAL